ncbi:PREDICTED: putative nuclease HARBI1 isoform X1 [Rhagoletis zephyria]|uniref:putative nuclease HARBI1 isoform X1 n=1 Tax=Rhagoletis zephyria TaxID=28612 RepID=UPI00081174D9|nr:PREDICTED: putative nuclease HARBI1 isoform X1 [Rhagoletis zephyria]
MNKKRASIAFASLCLIATLKAWKKNKCLKRNKKQWWIRPGLRHRATSGFYSTLRFKLRQQDPQWFKNFVRMSCEDFDYLVEHLTPYIGKSNTRFRKAISVGERLAVTLRYLATGDSFSSLMTVFLIGKTTICHIVHETCAAIFTALKDKFLKVPNTPGQWAEVADQFAKRWNFPNCCGALDGKHIMIQAPANCGSEYFNYKKFNSIVLMALVDAEYKFLFVEVGAYGRESDGGVFARCKLSSALADNTINFPPRRPLPNEADPMPFVIIADDAFPLKPYILKPFSYREQVMSHKIFNYRLSRARNVVENVFGICAARFRILRRPMDVKPENAKTIVLAICVIHNFLISRNSSYLTRTDTDNETNGELVAGNWRLELGPNGKLISLRASTTLGRPADDAINVRAAFMEYFMTPYGEVPWQYNRTIIHNSF